MAWQTICRPTCFGGLGVKNLQFQGLTMRVRWEWLRRTDFTRPWQGLQLMVDRAARAVFDSMVLIKVGEGSRVLFWTDRWLHGFAVGDIAPLIASMVDARTKSKRIVHQALMEDEWLHDIRDELSFMAHI